MNSQDQGIQACRNNITGDLPARILYSREELLQLRYSVTPPPDIPDEIRRREESDRNGTWKTIGHVPFKARNTWKPSMRKDRVEHHPKTATPSEMGIQQDRRIQVCRNNITGDLPARILYSREELLQLQYSVTPPPDIPDEIRRREQGDRNGTWGTISHVPFKARNTWKPSMRKDGVEHHPQTATIQSTETRKIIGGVSFSNDVKLHMVQNAWKPSNRKAKVEQDPEKTATQELFGQMRSILNKLTPERFEKLMKQVSELSINTEDHLEGIGNMVFEKAIGEVKFTSTYANMCHYLKELTVPCLDPSFQLNFRLLMLHLCRKEFFRVNGDGKILEKELQDLNAANTEEESLHLKEELGAKVIAHRRRAVGTMKFLGELFKLNMVRDVVILGCVSTYLDTQSEEALECLCCLITTTGTALDCENVKPQMDGYFSQLNQILKEGKSTSRVRFMLQDVMDLRQNNWVPRRYEQGPKIISQVHEEAELEILLGKMQLLSIATEVAQAELVQSTISAELAQAEQVKSTISTELAQAEQVQSTITEVAQAEQVQSTITELAQAEQVQSTITEFTQAEQVQSTIATELAQAEQVQSTISTPMNNWVPRRYEQGPKIISQVHEEAELEILLGKMQLLSISTELAQAEQVQGIITELAQVEQVQSIIATELPQAEQVQSTISTKLAQAEQDQSKISTPMNNCVPRRYEQGTKIMSQVHEEAELEILLGKMQLLSISTELTQAEQVQSIIATELAQAEKVQTTISTELALAEQVQSTITELAQAEQVQSTFATELAQAEQVESTISTKLAQAEQVKSTITELAQAEQVQNTISTELAQADQVQSTISTELAQAEQVQTTISTELAQAEQVQTTISTELAQAARDERTIFTPMVQGTETLKIISNVSFSHDVKLHVVQNAWRPSFRQAKVDQDPEMTVTQELFRRMRSILNKVTPETFDQLVKQVAELQMDTTERLQGVVDIIFEKAICEPKFASTYARMCHCLKELHAPINDWPEVTLHFQQAILNRCWMQFNERAEEEANVTAQRRRSIGNMTFLGELFKLEMAEEYFMHRCITTLLDSQEEALLECLCCLLSTIGSKLDCDKAKCHMDKYTRQMEQIIKAGKTSSRISFMVKDIMDLRQNNWAPRNSDQGPKTIRQVHKQAELERSKVEQQLQSKGNWDHRHWNRGEQQGHGGEHRWNRGQQQGHGQDQRWNRGQEQGHGQDQRWNRGQQQGHSKDQRWNRGEHCRNHGEQQDHGKRQWNHGEQRGHGRQQQWNRVERQGHGKEERSSRGGPHPAWRHGTQQQNEGVKTAESEQHTPINSSQKSAFFAPRTIRYVNTLLQPSPTPRYA